MLYFAYGSNMSAAQMKRRCPDAVKVRPILVDDCKLTFRGVADVVYDPGFTCPGGLWDITDRCERALDGFEGVEARTYLKRFMDVRIKKKTHKCLYYQMSISKGVMPPSEQYLETIAEGYRDFGLDLADLDAALARSWADKDITNRMAQRYIDRGKPKLARISTPAHVPAPVAEAAGIEWNEK